MPKIGLIRVLFHLSREIISTLKHAQKTVFRGCFFIGIRCESLVRNTKLDYFHSNILTNIDLFVEDDFNVFYIICNQNEKNIQHTFETDSYKTTISKFKTIGIIPTEDFIVAESPPKHWDENNYKFNNKTNDYESLCKYINEYFSS